MHFTTITAEGVEFPVAVELDSQGHEGAVFTTTTSGEEIRDSSFLGLRRQLIDMITASRIEVPFIDANGNRGIMRGIHAGNRDILVTWENGEKGRISNYANVYPDADADAVDRAVDSVATAKAHLDVAEGYLKRALGSAVTASDVFARALAVDLLDRAGIREREAALAGDAA